MRQILIQNICDKFGLNFQDSFIHILFQNSIQDQAKYCKHTYKLVFGSIKCYLSSFDTIVDVEAYI